MSKVMLPDSGQENQATPSTEVPAVHPRLRMHSVMGDEPSDDETFRPTPHYLASGEWNPSIVPWPSIAAQHNAHIESVGSALLLVFVGLVVFYCFFSFIRFLLFFKQFFFVFYRLLLKTT